MPADYDPSQFPAFAVTVDIVILTMSAGALHVLLVRRGEAPFEGMWAIPGGFKRPTETLDEAARRELVEETGVDVASLLTQFGAYGDPGRDPRMNVVTVAYLAALRDVGAVVAGTDAAEAALVPVSDVLNGRIDLAFDHLRIVRDAIERVRVELEVTASRRRSSERRSRWPSCGRCTRPSGRAARRRELPAQHRRRGRLGDPDRAPSSTRLGRRQARGALSSQGEAWSHGGPIHRIQRTRRGSERMRAVVHDRYGPPEVLRLEEVERPVPEEDEVLVRIHATTVNRTDCGFRSAEAVLQPLLHRSPPAEAEDPRHASWPARSRRSAQPSRSSRSATSLRRQRVGAHAEFVCVRESGPLAHKPAGMTSRRRRRSATARSSRWRA